MKTVSSFILTIAIPLAASYPGLLKIPKVYNALITSDQNLTPSRAFPVLQPVIHRTAVGYVPPLYYPQFAPQYVPDVVELTQLSNANLDNEANKGNEDKSKEPGDNKMKEGDGEKDQQKPEVPLKFYPNYQTVLYEPYFYAYSGLGPRVEPVSYQDYQSQQMLDPLPPERNEKYPERLLPHLQEEGSQQLVGEQKIPDVPPPPLPTSSPKVKSTS